jgi:uncharacterized membrane protein
MTRAQRRVGITYVFAGIMHFVIPKQYEAIMPDYLPAHKELVAASGVAEIAGGAGILVERVRKPAAWWMIATLVAVFPANLHMALHPDRYRQVPRWALYARLPFQALFIWDVWRTAIRNA